MRRKYGRQYKSLINKLPQILIIVIFCIGMIVGSLFANQLYDSSNSQIEEVERLVENFIVSINVNSVPKFYLFRKALLTYSKQILFIWLFGLFTVTIPLIGLLVGVIGFSYGFTTSFFLIQYNFKGLLICLAAYGIQSILFTSLIFALSMETISYAKKEKPTNFKAYVIYLLMAILMAIGLALFEAYITPIFIQQTITIFFQ